MNNLGISSYAYYWAIKGFGVNQVPPWSLWDLLERVVALDLNVLQICENMPLLNYDLSDLKRLRETARKFGVILEVGARGLNINNILSNFEITRFLEAHTFRLTPWSGAETRRRFPLEELHRVVDHLIPLCRRYDISLAIENYFDLSDDELGLFVEQVDDEHVGVCLDTANSLGLLEKPLRTAERLAPFVISLHLKDYLVTKPTMGYVISGVPLGQGWLDVQAVLDVIHRAGRTPNILLEMWVEPAENQEATLRKEDEWVCQSVNYARNYLGISSKT